MYNVKAAVVRGRLDSALDMLNSSEHSDISKMKELWAILSDINLWMVDIEEKLDARTQKQHRQ